MLYGSLLVLHLNLDFSYCLLVWTDGVTWYLFFSPLMYVIIIVHEIDRRK